MKSVSEINQRLLRTQPAAKYIGVSDWKLRQLIQDGRIPYLQFEANGPFMLDVRDLDRYIDGNKQMGGDLC